MGLEMAEIRPLVDTADKVVGQPACLRTVAWKALLMYDIQWDSYDNNSAFTGADLFIRSVDFKCPLDMDKVH